MIVVRGKTRIEHSGTGVVYSIDSSQVEFEFDHADNRQMGSEKCYVATLDHHELGDLAWTVYEYPEGCLNHYENPQELSGHKVLEDFSVDIQMD